MITCIFCQTTLVSSEFDYCPKCHVTYSVGKYSQYYEFDIQMVNDRYYWYFIDSEVAPRKTSFIWRHANRRPVISFDFHPPNITPANVKEKLNTILTFL
jgi:hypothetical protein